MEGFRIERDSMGELRVPVWAYYGAQTQRALENFPISGRRMPRELIHALGLVKLAAARANMDLGLLDLRLGEAISRASMEVAEGRLDGEFVVDVFQTGSGTSTNMNANEVIANRANEILGAPRGAKSPVHPNDHVNMSQSSNDVIPTAIHVAAVVSMKENLLPAMKGLLDALGGKALEFDRVLKLGRTHLQDALPVRLGQEFGAYASQVAHGMDRVGRSLPSLLELALGGTAVGTGLNAPEGFARLAISHIGELTGYRFVQAPNLFEALSSRDALVEASGQLKVVAVSLMKIANDLRWMSSGPHGGIGEISLPELQPGSSIMPGKVNPVIPECVMMVAAAVLGNDTAISTAGQHGSFELHTMMPVMGDRLLDSIRILSSACRVLEERCVRGIVANEARALSLVEASQALVTPLAPVIGYDAAASLAREALDSGKTIRELAREKKILPDDQLERLLDLRSLTGP
ncbi:MAG: class II fumarate hydratase [Thermodesulfobacteriota bacterium]